YTLVIACSDVTAEQLTLNKKEIEMYTQVSVVDPNLFYTAFDKLQTMRVCMENDIPCPKTYFDCSTIEDVFSKNLSFPLIIKPRQGYGAIGFHKFDTKQELKQYLSEHQEDIEHLVIQEYIPQTDKQYEAAMFVDNNNQVKSAMVFEKNRWFPVSGGSSTLNTSVTDEEIVKNCTKLMKTINWRWCADIDLIRDPRDGVTKIMEINPRMSGSAKIVFLSDIDMAKQLLQMAVGEEVTNYSDYKKGVRLRCLYTDFLWFIKSPNRFRAKPSWFDFKNTHEQVFSWKDPVPYFAFSINSLLKLRKELDKRK
ncbi:MAG: ATP-grasp domain-containing protein, partial [Ruminococcus sp.]|nr:ATP-grasp domain-containing protein [Candidatus Copronaster equi]